MHFIIVFIAAASCVVAQVVVPGTWFAKADMMDHDVDTNNGAVGEFVPGAIYTGLESAGKNVEEEIPGALDPKFGQPIDDDSHNRALDYINSIGYDQLIRDFGLF